MYEKLHRSGHPPWRPTFAAGECHCILRCSTTRPCHRSAEPTFAHLEHYVPGLLADLKRKSIEPIALAAAPLVREPPAALSSDQPSKTSIGTSTKAG